MTGKFTPDKSWNIIKTDGSFEIDGHAADSARKRNMAQNAIYCLVKDNEGIKQFEIADRLNKAHSNVNRDLKNSKGMAILQELQRRVTAYLRSLITH